MPEYLDIYCERTAPGLWQEPLNTLTNLGFIVAAGLLLRLYLQVYRGRHAQGWDRLLLIALLAAIGVGSGLWHLTAQPWAMLADVLPITGFISVLLLVLLVRVVGLSLLATLSIFLLYHAANWVVQACLPPDSLNGSVFYLPSWTALVLMTVWLAHRGHGQWPDYALASVLFLVSLTLRTMDQAWCESLPMGTHFIWHLLNALLLYMLVRGLLQAPTLKFSQGSPRSA